MTAPQDELVARGIFLRKASGLVKMASATDALIFNIGLINIGFGIAFNALYGRAFYPGASIEWASIFTLLLWLPVGFAFLCWSYTFPRSGASYIFPSRSWHPWLGMTIGFNEAFAFLFFTGVPAAWISQMGLTNVFFSVGAMSGNPELTQLAISVMDPWVVVTIGVAAIVLTGLIVVSGTRNFFRVQKALFLYAMIGTVLMLLVFILPSREANIASFNRYMNPILGTADSYNYVMTEAAAAGYTSAGMDWWQSLRLVVWPSLPMVGSIGTIAIGGEIKRFHRSQAIALMGGIIICGLFFIGGAWATNFAMGEDFVGAVGYLSIVAPDKFPTLAWPAMYSAFLSNNLAIAFVITTSFVLWPWFWMGASILFADRTLLAMALDRMLPDKMGEVSPRWHTPVWCVLVATLWAIGCLFIFVFPLKSIPPTAALWYVWWSVLMVSGIFFPFMRKGLYEKSPISRWTLGPVPFFSVICAVSTVILGFLTYLILTDPIAAGPLDFQFWTLIIYTAVPTAMYFIMRYHRKKQGIDVSLAFKELPIE